MAFGLGTVGLPQSQLDQIPIFTNLTDTRRLRLSFEFAFFPDDQ